MAQLRQDFPRYDAAGVQPYVIAAQGPRAVQGFLAKQPLPFPWLLDTRRQVMKRYGVYNRFSYDAWKLAHPAAVLADREGVVRYIYRCSTQWDIPTREVMLAAVEGLRS